MDKLSIIITTYNSQKYIEKCLRSIINQSYRNLEIIIIDDASNDDTVKICKRIKDDRIRIFCSESNKGVSYSRNLGILYATGKYVTFVDSDDYIESSMYEQLLKKMDNNIDIVMCDFFMEYNEKDIRRNRNIECIKNDKEILEEIFLQSFFAGFVWNKIYKMDLIEKENIKFNENIYICEDLLFNCVYISKMKYNGYYLGNKLYHYVQRNNSAYNNMDYNNKWLTVIDAYEKINSIIKYGNKEIILNFKFSYLYALLNLKEKIIITKYKNTELEEKVNQLIYGNSLYIKKNNSINLWIKLKVFLKINFMNEFIRIKKICNSIRRTTI